MLELFSIELSPTSYVTAESILGYAQFLESRRAPSMKTPVPYQLAFHEERKVLRIVGLDARWGWCTIVKCVHRAFDIFACSRTAISLFPELVISSTPSKRKATLNSARLVLQTLSIV